jgi:hypothetical protein
MSSDGKLAAAMARVDRWGRPAAAAACDVGELEFPESRLPARL